VNISLQSQESVNSPDFVLNCRKKFWTFSNVWTVC